MASERCHGLARLILRRLAVGLIRRNRLQAAIVSAVIPASKTGTAAMRIPDRAANSARQRLRGSRALTSGLKPVESAEPDEGAEVPLRAGALFVRRFGRLAAAS